jgi:hypothetical protein
MVTYRTPLWEEVWSEFVTADAEYSISEAQPEGWRR